MRVRFRLFAGDNLPIEKVEIAVCNVRTFHPGEDVIISVEPALGYQGVTRGPRPEAPGAQKTRYVEQGRCEKGLSGPMQYPSPDGPRKVGRDPFAANPPQWNAETDIPEGNRPLRVGDFVDYLPSENKPSTWHGSVVIGFVQDQPFLGYVRVTAPDGTYGLIKPCELRRQ